MITALSPITSPLALPVGLLEPEDHLLDTLCTGLGWDTSERDDRWVSETRRCGLSGFQHRLDLGESRDNSATMAYLFSDLALEAG